MTEHRRGIGARSGLLVQAEPGGVAVTMGTRETGRDEMAKRCQGYDNYQQRGEDDHGRARAPRRPRMARRSVTYRMPQPRLRNMPRFSETTIGTSDAISTSDEDPSPRSSPAVADRREWPPGSARRCYHPSCWCRRKARQAAVSGAEESCTSANTGCTSSWTNGWLRRPVRKHVIERRHERVRTQQDARVAAGDHDHPEDGEDAQHLGIQPARTAAGCKRTGTGFRRPHTAQAGSRTS